jgi:hypothetical protein
LAEFSDASMDSMALLLEILIQHAIAVLVGL